MNGNFPADFNHIYRSTLLDPAASALAIPRPRSLPGIHACPPPKPFPPASTKPSSARNSAACSTPIRNCGRSSARSTTGEARGDSVIAQSALIRPTQQFSFGHIIDPHGRSSQERSSRCLGPPNSLRLRLRLQEFCETQVFALWTVRGASPESQDPETGLPSNHKTCRTAHTVWSRGRERTPSRSQRV